MKILFASDTSFNFMDSVPIDGEAVKVMSETAGIFKIADYSILNLENIFGNKEGYIPIPKSGPNLISNDKFIDYIDALKPTAIGLANNHSLDFGESALSHTIGILKEHGYQVCGAGENIDMAYEPAIFDDGTVKVHVIAVCENEFGTATTKSSGTAGYSLKRVSDAIKKSLCDGAEPIIYFHGGNETNPFPSPEKTELYRHFIDIGAKAVVGMHTHCPQGYEIYKGCPVVYSMGNFFFPVQNDVLPTWSMGYMTMLDITKDNLSMEVIPYTFDADRHTLLKGEKKDRFNKYLTEISTVISDSEKVLKFFESWCIKTGIEYMLGYISFDDKMYSDVRMVSSLKNIFSCEAHAELMKHTLRLIYENRVDEARKLVPYIEKLQNFKL